MTREQPLPRLASSRQSQRFRHPLCQSDIAQFGRQGRLESASPQASWRTKKGPCSFSQGMLWWGLWRSLGKCSSDSSQTNHGLAGGSSLFSVKELNAEHSTSMSNKAGRDGGAREGGQRRSPGTNGFSQMPAQRNRLTFRIVSLTSGPLEASGMVEPLRQAARTVKTQMKNQFAPNAEWVVTCGVQGVWTGSMDHRRALSRVAGEVRSRALSARSWQTSTLTLALMLKARISGNTVGPLSASRGRGEVEAPDDDSHATEQAVSIPI